jgi:hypothetical protein
MNRFVSSAPTVVFNLLQQLEALGLDVPTVLSQLGISQNGDGATAQPAQLAKTTEE